MSKDNLITTNNPIDDAEVEYLQIECADTNNDKSSTSNDDKKSTTPNLDSIRSAGF